MKPVLIEATRKRYKLYQLIGVGIILIALVFLGLSIRTESPFLIYTAAIFIAVGIGVTMVGGVLAWWHHG